MEHNLVGDQNEPGSLLHDRVLRFAAAAAVAVSALLLLFAVAWVVAVAVAFCGRCSTRCNVLSVHCLSVCLFPHFSHFASSAGHWVSSTLSPSRACSAALLAARQTRRRPLALRMLDPSSIRIHHAFPRHVSVRHITVFTKLVSVLSFTLLLNAFFLRSISYLFTFLFSPPPGPQLHSLALFAPSEHSLLSHSS